MNFVALGLTLLTTNSFADKSWPDETQEPSLHALPMNSIALRKNLESMFEDIQKNYSNRAERTILAFPHYSLFEGITDFKSTLDATLTQQKAVEQSPICKKIGLGCFLIQYYDHPEIDHISSGSSLFEINTGDLLKQSGLNTSCYFVGLDHKSSKIRDKIIDGADIGRHFHPLEDDSFTYEYDCKKIVKKAYSDKKILENLNIAKTVAFKTNEIIAKTKEALLNTGTLPQDLQNEILKNPYSFKDLPAIYQTYMKNISAQAALDDVMGKSLWLTLEALTASAFSTSSHYPYLIANNDQVNNSNFITADWAYLALEKLKRNVRMISLTPELRTQLSGPCEANHCHGFSKKTKNGNWYTIAAYEPNTNSFYVDYTQDFYETVYALEHELWHAITENTEESQKFRTRVEALAQLPESEQVDLALKQTIYWSVIQNELHAIHQSNLLYRFAGQLTHQWGGNSPSAKAWFETELVSPYAYIPYTYRMHQYLSDHQKDNALDDWTGDSSIKSFFEFYAIVPMFTEMAIDHAHSKSMDHEKEVLAGIDQKLDGVRGLLQLKNKVEQSFPPQVIELFSERYKLTLPDFQDFEQTDNLSKMKFQKPDPVKLTCDQAKHIASLMPAEWEHGIPFSFVVTDGDCSVGDGHQPENAGSHPSINAIPSVNALPCLNGAE